MEDVTTPKTTTAIPEATPNQLRLRAEASHRRPSEEDQAKLKRFRQAALDFAVAIDALCPDGRAKSLALTNADQARQWGCNAIVANGVVMETLEINPPK